MDVIDFHTHAFPPELICDRSSLLLRDAWFSELYANPRSRMSTVEDLLASMERAEISASVAFGFAFRDLGLCRACNDYLLAAGRDHPGRILPFAVVNPCAGKEALEEADRCLAAGACGIGELMPDGQGFDLADTPLLDPVMELARGHGVPIMFHVNEEVGHRYAGKGRYGPKQAFGLATQYPHNTLILSHWGGGLLFYELMPEVRAALERVYYDTAASLYLYDIDIFRYAMALVPHKVLWGSDYPLIAQQRFLRHIAETGLAGDQRAQLLGGNAQRLLSGFEVVEER